MALKHLILNIIEDALSNIKTCAKKLKHNIVLNINIGVNKVLTNKHWIYFPEDKFVFYRVGFSSNFSKYICPKGHSSIYTEVSVEENFDYENSIEIYKEKVVEDLVKAKILSSKKDVVDITPLVLNPAYVSYDFHRDKNVEKILNYLEEKNIYSIGRFGLWEYSDMETAIDQGLKISDEIINGNK